MPTPAEDKKLAATIDRVFTDQKFARDMQADPVKALASAGYKLNAKQKEQLVHLRALPEEVAALSWTRPVVRILTRGTKPAVSVLVRTVVVSKAKAQSPEE